MPTSPAPASTAFGPGRFGRAVAARSLFTAGAQNAHLDALGRVQVARAKAYAAEVGVLLDWFDLVGLDQGCDPDLAAMELAPVLRVGQRRAASLLGDALRLRDQLPVLLAALGEGIVWCPQAAVILFETGGCSPAVCAGVQARLLGPGGAGAAGSLCPGDLRRSVRRAVLAVEAELEPQVTEQREQRSRDSRDVTMRPARDGMVQLWALLTVEQALGHARDLDTLCKKVALEDRAAGIARTAGQRRADVLAMLPTIALRAWDTTHHTGGPAADHSAPDTLNPGSGPGGDGPGGETGNRPGGCACLFGPGAVPAGGLGPGVELVIHVPMATALGMSGQPGEILGHGPVGAHTIRRLLPDATLRRLLVDNVTGQPLHLDPHPVDPRTVDARPVNLRAGDPPAVLTRRSRPPGDPHVQPDAPPTRADERARRVLLGWLDLSPETHTQAPGHTAAETSPTVNDSLPASGCPGAQNLALAGEVWLHDAPERRHDPSAGLARFLRIRDPLCTGPGCSTSAARCDLDHERPYGHGEQPGGLTTAANLSPKSRRCHRAKTPHPGNPNPWTVQRNPDGSTTWTSPLGRVHTRPGYWSPPPTPRRATSTGKAERGPLDDFPSAGVADLPWVLAGCRPGTVVAEHVGKGWCTRSAVDLAHLPSQGNEQDLLTVPLQDDAPPF